MNRAEEDEDLKTILGMLYGKGSSVEVAFRHRESDIVHRVQSNAQAIGITFCGTRITRRNSSEWITANFEPVTCIGCIGCIAET